VVALTTDVENYNMRSVELTDGQSVAVIQLRQHECHYIRYSKSRRSGSVARIAPEITHTTVKTAEE